MPGDGRHSVTFGSDRGFKSAFRRFLVRSVLGILHLHPVLKLWSPRRSPSQTPLRVSLSWMLPLDRIGWCLPCPPLLLTTRVRPAHGSPTWHMCPCSVLPRPCGVSRRLPRDTCGCVAAVSGRAHIPVWTPVLQTPTSCWAVTRRSSAPSRRVCAARATPARTSTTAGTGAGTPGGSSTGEPRPRVAGAGLAAPLLGSRLARRSALGSGPSAPLTLPGGPAVQGCQPSRCPLGGRCGQGVAPLFPCAPVACAPSAAGACWCGLALARLGVPAPIARFTLWGPDLLGLWVWALPAVMHLVSPDLFLGHLLLPPAVLTLVPGLSLGLPTCHTGPVLGRVGLGVQNPQGCPGIWALTCPSCGSPALCPACSLSKESLSSHLTLPRMPRLAFM